jgi:DNA-binding transcriptional ArsR family regulator
MTTMTADRLDDACMALADPTRRAIVARLARGDATVTELAEPFSISMPAISKHLRVLERSGLITRSRQAQTRPCHLEREPLDAAIDWIEASRQLWNARFDKLEAHLRDVQAAPATKTTPPTKDTSR